MSNLKKWDELLINDTTAKFIENMYNYVQPSDDTKCKTCNIEYCNVGNRNKHYKQHPECFKLFLYTIMDKYSNEEYYKNWPNSLYNIDLNNANKTIINYLRTIPTEFGHNKAIVFDCDDTLLYDDPSGVTKIEEIEYVDKNGDTIFILPPNNEIVDLAIEAKKLGFRIIILTLRPQTSLPSTIENLKMHRVIYDEIVHNENLCGTDDKHHLFEKISNKYDIICTIGDQEYDCYVKSPFSVKLPDPNCRYVKIYKYGNLV